MFSTVSWAGGRIPKPNESLLFPLLKKAELALGLYKYCHEMPEAHQQSAAFPQWSDYLGKDRILNLAPKYHNILNDLS